MDHPLKAYRLSIGLNQQQLADLLAKRMRCRVSQSDVSRWELGERGRLHSLRLAVEAATLGNVSADEWREWLDTVGRSEPRRRRSRATA